MKKLLREYIRKQIDKLLESQETDAVQAIKSKDEEVKAAEDEIKNVEKMQKDAVLQQQNKQKVTSTQVGTLGDSKSKDIKTQDVKRDIELYKKQSDELKNKQDADKKTLELKKTQLNAEKAKVISAKTSQTPSTPAPPIVP